MLAVGAASAQESQKSVLLLNSYHPQYAWTDAITRNFVAEVTPYLAKENIHIDYLDGRFMLGDAAFKKTLITELAIKAKRMNPSVVVTSDDFATEIMLEYGDVLFPNVPIVYSGVNFSYPELLAKDNIVGILEGVAIKENIALIHQIQPDLGNLIILSDKTEFGSNVTGLVEDILASRVDNPWTTTNISIWNDFAFDDLPLALSDLPPRSAVLIVAIHADNNGRYFSYETHLPALTDASSAPVYGMFGALMLGNGIVGGLINSPAEHGRMAGQLAVALLKGESVASLPKQQVGHYLPKFDANVLTKYGLDIELLPVNSEIVNVSKYSRVDQRIYIIFFSLAGAALLLFLLVYNVYQRRIAEELAFTDSLTQLPNRRAGEEWLATHWQQSSGVVALGLLDIDKFKSVNDQFGHDVGDYVLVEVAKRLQGSLRGADKLYRWGGEEFLICVALKQDGDVKSTFERLRQIVSDTPFTTVGDVSVSIGVAVTDTVSNYEEIMKSADRALYESKHSGRNKVTYIHL